jgi:hypothetical protein
MGFMRIGAGDRLPGADRAAGRAVAERARHEEAEAGPERVGEGGMNELMRNLLWLPPQASTLAPKIDNLHYFVITVTMARRS